MNRMCIRAFSIITGSHRHRSLPKTLCPATLTAKDTMSRYRSINARLQCRHALNVCLAYVPTFTHACTAHTHVCRICLQHISLMHVRHVLTCHPYQRDRQTHPKMDLLSLLPTPQKTATSQTCAFVRAFVRAYGQGVCACKRRRALCRATASSGVRVCNSKGEHVLGIADALSHDRRVHTHAHTRTHTRSICDASNNRTPSI